MKATSVKWNPTEWSYNLNKRYFQYFPVIVKYKPVHGRNLSTSNNCFSFWHVFFFPKWIKIFWGCKLYRGRVNECSGVAKMRYTSTKSCRRGHIALANTQIGHFPLPYFQISSKFLSIFTWAARSNNLALMWTDCSGIALSPVPLSPASTFVKGSTTDITSVRSTLVSGKEYMTTD